MRRFTIIFIIALSFTALLLVHSAMADTTFACQPGATYTFKGSGPPNTALILRFDDRPVGGSTTDANGAYRVRLAVGQEPPGSYAILVEVRQTHQRVAAATCIIPAPNPTQGVVGAPKQPGVSQSTSTPAATVTAAPSLTAAAEASATQTSVTSNSTATASPTTTSTPTATNTGTPATATLTTTGTQATSTTTGTPATATPTGSTTATTTSTPTITETDDPSDDDPTLDIGPGEDEDGPFADKPFVIAGTVTDSNGDGIANVTVTVTYRYEGSGGEKPWCTATTTSPDGAWECKAITISADLKDKEVTWTGTIVVGGKTIQEEDEETVDES